MQNFFGQATDWLGNAIEDVGSVIGDVTEFVSGLPAEIRNVADRLNQRQREAGADAARNVQQYEVNRMLGAYGPYIVLGGIALAVVMLAGK